MSVENKSSDGALEWAREAHRLTKLSDMDLIRECMKDEVSDSPLVQELMNRVKPNWLDEL